MKKFYKIGEISKLYGIGVDSLRYYEEIGVITPQRSECGYRLYSINDIWRLNVIRELRELGFSMEQIKHYLDCHTVKSTLDLLEEEERTIQTKLQRLKQLQANVRQRMNTIEAAQSHPLHQILLENYPPRQCFTIPEGYSDDHEMDVLIQRLLNIDKGHFFVIGNNQIGTVISLQDAKSSSSLKYQSVFIMDESGETRIPGGTYLSVSYKGNYNQSADWIVKLLQYAEIHHLTPAGDILEILWIDIHTTSDQNEHITELQIPVKQDQ